MKSRKAVELISKFAQLALEDLGRGDLRDRIAPYRAGYTAQQRRELERRLVDGELLGVVSTDALELGIDIGSLDAAICVTFPGTVASLRQMWGRAGRRGRGLAVYVAGDDALDQFFCRHPDEFLDRPVEAAILDPFNEQIHAGHVLCAAHEGPLEPADAEFLGAELEPTTARLEAMGALRRRPGGTWVPRDTARVPGRRGVAALDGARRVHDRRPRLGRAARHRRREPRVQHDAPGRGLPARRPRVRGRGARHRRAARARAPVRGRLVHAGQARDRHAHHAARRPPRVARRDALVRHRARDGAGRRLPVAPARRPRGARPRRARPPLDVVRDAGAVVRAAGRDRGARPPARPAPRVPPRRRARADRRAAAARDVRPVGHRRPLDELPPADRRADDLHLRRAPRRHRHHAPRLPRLRRAGRRRAPADRRVPVREGLPVLRAVAEVRQPQRAALQGRRAAADGPDARADDAAARADAP